MSRLQKLRTSALYRDIEFQLFHWLALDQMAWLVTFINDILQECVVVAAVTWRFSRPTQQVASRTCF